MTRVTIDSTVREELTAPGETVELVDESGTVIETFRPAVNPPYDPSWVPDIDADERERRATEPGGSTTDEVVRHLESL
ncbi:MAG: hypothetical protein ACE5KM_13205 [Planctomycetaceae bacterium]